MAYITKRTNAAKPDWQSNHDYNLFDMIDADSVVPTTTRKGRRYMCVQPGKSANSGSGPSGTGLTIADGTTVWRYIGQALIVVAMDDSSNPSHSGPPTTWSEAPNDAGCYVVYVNQPTPYTYAPVMTPQHLHIPLVAGDVLVDGSATTPPIPGAPVWTKFSLQFP